MDLGLDGKRALVLGGSGGLGSAGAIALAAEGVHVIAASRNSVRIDAAYAGREKRIADLITPQEVDLSSSASIKSLIGDVLAKGGVDILVNNVGGPKPGGVQGQTVEAWSLAFEAMALSIFRITEALLPAMLEKGWGRIITIGSSGVEQPIPNLALSNTIRAAVAGWSKTLAAEIAAAGVTVNMVLPGRIETDRVRALDNARATSTGRPIEEIRQASRADIPAGRYGRTDEFGATIAFLASTNASYITGSMLRVDGGMIRGV
jgi:3-oxoacyl-[acyl-carrier protein] reductase